MFKYQKLLLASLTTAVVFSASICAHAAGIDSLSLVDNTIYATTDAEDARLYAVRHSEGLLSDVFFKDIENGEVTLAVGEASEYELYLWGKDSLAPISVAYKLTDGKAYKEGSTSPVPEYDFSDYSFNQEDNVMIVSSISNGEIKGFKAGIETMYALTSNVAVLGISDSLEDVVPGSVVMIGTNKTGDCAAIELLASLGMPVAKENFEDDFGTYSPSDGSSKYQNLVNEMYSKSGSKLTVYTLDENGQKILDENDRPITQSYYFEANRNICYRVGIAIDTATNTPVITTEGKPISTYPSIFEKTNEYHNYLYLRLNTESGKLVECVYYCLPKNIDFTPGPDDPWTEPFEAGTVVITK